MDRTRHLIPNCYGLPRVEGEGRETLVDLHRREAGFQPWGSSPTAGQEEDLFLLASHGHTPSPYIERVPLMGYRGPLGP
jgi:hypothetical protein